MEYIGGTLKRVKDKDGTVRSWTMHGTFYEPKATARISSHASIKATPGFHICLNDLSITTAAGIVLPIHESNGMYILDVFPPTNFLSLEELLLQPTTADTVGRCLVVTPATSDLTMRHFQLGHLSESTLRKTAAHKQSTLVLPTRSRLGLCPDCPFGKIKRSTHDNSHTGPRTTVRGRKFHFDTHGPYSVKQIP